MFITEFMIGGMSAIISRTLTAPLELYKTQRQNYFIPDATIRSVLRKEGIRYLWKGNYTNCIRAFPQFAITNGIYVKTNNVTKNIINNDIYRNLVCGSISGSIAMICIYPLETIKTHLSLQINKSHYNGTLDAFKKLKTNQLYKGLTVSIIGYSKYNTICYGVNNYLNKHYKIVESNRYKNSFKVFYGGMAGVTAISITYPTDLIRKRLQLQGFNKSVPIYNGFWDCFIKIIKTDGISGLYKGLPINIIKTFLMCGIHFWGLDYLKISK